ncbi:hypothetical protein NCS52_00032400 [Fusarium sp. LHS14.1]|nr:hypothetical protein NCS52_00032400 [Fusarium sp. LHS14.1]
MAPWGSWGPEPPSEANNVVTGRDFTVVDLPADKINEREYGTASPAFTKRHTRKDSWGTYGSDHRPFQRPGPPREVPCLQCANRMMVRGFHGLCRDHMGTTLGFPLGNATGKCYCCVLHGVECKEVPEAAFKSSYELQVCARKMDEGHEDTDWERLSCRAELALLKEDLLWSPRKGTAYFWDGNKHVHLPVNGKTGWDGSDNIDVNADVNQVNIAKTYWNDDSNTDWNVNENANFNADTNQAGNNKPGWDDTCVPRWNTSWDDRRTTSWGDESDSDSENARVIKTTPTSEIDDDCDDESDDVQGPVQLTPEFSSADKIISAIDRNTDVVADLCEIMEGLKVSLEVLHEDNVKSKDLLQKLLNEQRAVGDKQTKESPQTDILVT